MDTWIKIGKTLRHHGRAAMRNLRGIWWDLRRIPAERPIFVVGCSRAGTTLVYKTLSESPELGTLQRETHDFWIALHPLEERNWATHALGASDASPRDRDITTRYFYTWTGRSRWIDKNNQNGLSIPYLHALFPDATFVYVKRNPGDTLNSLIEGWGKQAKFSTWSDDLPVNVEVDAGRFKKWCFFLAEGWRDYLRAPVEEVCEFQYHKINAAILDARGSIPPSQWYEVRYEDLVEDPVAGFRRMFEACALSCNGRLEQRWATVLDRPYDAFSAIRIGKWKNQRHHDRIERVLPRLSGLARRMGY